MCKIYKYYSIIFTPMETGEKLEISNAVKLPFRVSSRDVYQFSYTDEYSHIVLQDKEAVDTFPIILVGE